MDPDSQSLSVAIAGAGLAGLCLGQALVRSGVSIQVFERDASPQARPQGYRLTVDEHGAAALKFCLPPRLFEAVLATASSPGDVGYFRFTNRDLGEIFTLTFKRDPRRIGQQMLGQVDRATLRTIMLSGLESRVHFGKTVSRIETAPDGTTLHFTDSSSIRAALAVGADGVHSAVRQQLLPNCPVKDTGARGIYGKTPLMKEGKSLVPDSLQNSGVMAIGHRPGTAFFYTTMRFNEEPAEVFRCLVPSQEAPIRTDYIMWAILLPETDVPSNFEELDPHSLLRLATDAAQSYHPVLRRFLELAEPAYTVAVVISAATRPTEWPGSRVTLIGDAVHVMPPTGAHGGNTALRDSACLAEAIQNVAAGRQSLIQAIGAYQAKMLDYSFKEVAQSVAMLNRLGTKNSLARFLMSQVMPWLRSIGGKRLV
jgi:2-polyprenyl-6-methoxyphenol hydroxylase-like FAD-dependent oxidoreductase